VLAPRSHPPPAAGSAALTPHKLCTYVELPHCPQVQMRLFIGANVGSSVGCAHASQAVHLC